MAEAFEMKAGNIKASDSVERCIMILEYEELKECVEEDFERFYKMGFNEKQIFPAVLNEYEHGEDFGLVENICIHVLLVLNYAEKNLNYHEIIEKLNQLMNEEVENEVKVELGNEYTKFIIEEYSRKLERLEIKSNEIKKHIDCC